MKKSLLIIIGVLSGFGAMAQQKPVTNHPSVELGNSALSNAVFNRHSGARTTATSTTDTFVNVLAADTATLYYAGTTSDTGFLSGTDFYGDMGYAERYDLGGSDSSVQVTGVIALFGGTVNPLSTKTVKFYTWNVGAPSPSPTLPYNNSGLPNLALDSVTAPITALSITPTAFGVTAHTFTTPTPYLTTSFFVGYTINYDPTALDGDTIGLVTSTFGERISPEAYISGTDTIINNQNTTLYSDGTWHDDWTDNFQAPYDFYIFPILHLYTSTTGLSSVTKNSLTFYGNYPNPSSDNTNIKFSLANNTDVTIIITDMAGRTINTINETNLASGMHIIPVATANMPAGDYIYLVRTASGDGMASKMTVNK